MMAFGFDVPDLAGGSISLSLEPGTSTFIVGANGSGKTRLAARAESHWGAQAHRISAHRALSLNPTVAKISEQKARYALRFGYADANEAEGMAYRQGNRWGSKAETFLLNDFDFIVQALFADQSNIALQTHNAAHARTLGEPGLTQFQKLTAIWDRVLHHRKLEITGDDIRAIANDTPYSAAQMSDGERAVFYMLGQALVAEPSSVLIFDEPELHVHRAILGRLWDEVEAARPDCAFLVITHDLEFAAARPGQKFVIRRYQEPNQWEVEPVPEDTGFDEEVTTLILGSRKPILFVEGTSASLDLAIYRACYPGWTVLPRGACENVIHAVATMRRNASLTRVTCSGIVDADDYSDEDKQQLAQVGVATLPVSEIENLFLLPEVATAILKEENFEGAELQAKLDALKQDVFSEIDKPGALEGAVLRYCRRRIDRTLKKIDLKDVGTVADLASTYDERTKSLNVVKIATEANERIEKAIREDDLPAILANFDSKALLALAAHRLKGTSKAGFESWITRTMRDPKANKLKAALREVLPVVEAH